RVDSGAYAVFAGSAGNTGLGAARALLKAHLRCSTRVTLKAVLSEEVAAGFNGTVSVYTRSR
ncbi:MAG: hypothetical protein JSU68_12195, partial [Phycisphaerales bacterium]